MTVCCPKCKTHQEVDAGSHKIIEHWKDPVAGTGERKAGYGEQSNRFEHVKIYVSCRGSGARVEIVA